MVNLVSLDENADSSVHGNSCRAIVVKAAVQHNGTTGISVNRAIGVLIEGNEIDHNNTDGSWVNDGQASGYKSTRATDTVRNNNVHDNNGLGLWFDIDDVGSLVEGNTVANNAATGIRDHCCRGHCCYAPYPSP